MKTLGRILMILLAFALVMGLTYVAVNASGSFAGSAAPAFERGGGGFRPDGARPDFRGGHGERDRGGWMAGTIRNVVIIALIVVLIVVPKSIRRKRIRAVSTGAG